MKRRVLQMQVEAQQEATQLSSLGPLGFAYLKGHSNARCALPDAFAKRTCLWNTEPASVSQKADTVKVGAVVSDTKAMLAAVPQSQIPLFPRQLQVRLYSRCLWHLNCLITAIELRFTDVCQQTVSDTLPNASLNQPGQAADTQLMTEFLQLRDTSRDCIWLTYTPES